MLEGLKDHAVCVGNKKYSSIERKTELLGLLASPDRIMVGDSTIKIMKELPKLS